MQIRKLDWDSNFFGLRIGRADITSFTDSKLLLSMQDEVRKSFDLIYIFDEKRIGFDAANASLVDEKVLYEKQCEQKQACNEVKIYNGNAPTEALRNLSIVSGGHSRFKLDKKLPTGCFEKLYQKWIEKACADTSEYGMVCTMVDDGKEIGMITTSGCYGLAHIGLVSVSPDFQHKGIGTKIMSTVESILFEKGVKSIEVPTQKSNKEACLWYEKNGFSVKSITGIYHWWL